MAGNLSRYSPFGDFGRLAPFGNLEEIFREFGMTPSWSGKDMPQLIRMDVSETDKDYTVRAEMPGCRKEDIKVSVEGNAVSISAEAKKEHEDKQDGNVVRSERYYGQMYRSFTLPQGVDDAQVQASYRDGILELILPKKAGGNGKQISIQ